MLDFAKFVKLSAEMGQPVIGVGVKYYLYQYGTYIATVLGSLDS
jgi:hypothetical protein